MAFPGIFPFDVNILLAVSAASLFILLMMFRINSIYLPRSFTLAVASVLALQVTLFTGEQLLAPEAWRLQVILYLAAAAMFIAGVSTPAASLRTWMNLYLVLAAVWSFAGLIVWLGGTSGMPLGIGPVAITMAPAVKLAGPFNQGNIFATAVGFAWIFAHWLYLTTQRSIYAAAIAFFTAMIIDSISRGGWGAYLVTVILLMLALKPKPSIYFRWLLPLWFAGVAIGILLFSLSQPQLQSNLLISSTSSTLYVRITYWVSAIIEFLSAPWTGVGWGQFGAHFWTANPLAQAWLLQNLGWSHLPSGNALSAHNLVLHTLAEGGPLMAILILWVIWRILLTVIAFLKNRRSRRLPFALAALGFVLHSQTNVVFTRPIPLLMAAFFAGIAMAPWLREKSWKISLHPAIRGTALVAVLLGMLWSGQLCYQWFAAEQATRNLDVRNKASVEKLVQFTANPRIRTISLLWLGYSVTKENVHTPLLIWMTPYLQASMHEVPSVSTYQILFYALVTSKKYSEACQIGNTIALQKFPNESNNQAYAEVCENRPPSRYRIGY